MKKMLLIAFVLLTVSGYAQDKLEYVYVCGGNYKIDVSEYNIYGSEDEFQYDEKTLVIHEIIPKIIPEYIFNTVEGIRVVRRNEYCKVVIFRTKTKDGVDVYIFGTTYPESKTYKVGDVLKIKKYHGKKSFKFYKHIIK